MTPLARRIVAELQANPNQTARELSVVLGARQKYIYTGIRTARRAHAIYVCGWKTQPNEGDVQHRSIAAVYRAGQGEDVPRPPRRSPPRKSRPEQRAQAIAVRDPLLHTRPVIEATRAYLSAYPERRAFACLLGQMRAL